MAALGKVFWASRSERPREAAALGLVLGVLLMTHVLTASWIIGILGRHTLWLQLHSLRTRRRLRWRALLLPAGSVALGVALAAIWPYAPLFGQRSMWDVKEPHDFGYPLKDVISSPDALMLPDRWEREGTVWRFFHPGTPPEVRDVVVDSYQPTKLVLPAWCFELLQQLTEQFGQLSGGSTFATAFHTASKVERGPVWKSNGRSSAIRNWLKVNPPGNVSGSSVLIRYRPSALSSMRVSVLVNMVWLLLRPLGVAHKECRARARRYGARVVLLDPCFPERAHRFEPTVSSPPFRATGRAAAAQPRAAPAAG